MKFGDKLKMLREERQMSLADFAKILGTSKQVLSRYERGENTPKITTVMEYAKTLGVSLAFLMNDDISNKQGEPEFYKISNIHSVETQKIPMLGEIACGQPIVCTEEHEYYVATGTRIQADFCLTCKGDSMTGAGIYDGSIVFIHKQELVDNGQIAAVLIDDEATLKRVYYYPEKSKLILQAENPKYEPLVYIGEELNGIRILGRAIAYQNGIV